MTLNIQKMIDLHQNSTQSLLAEQPTETDIHMKYPLELQMMLLEEIQMNSLHEINKLSDIHFSTLIENQRGNQNQIEINLRNFYTEFFFNSAKIFDLQKSDLNSSRRETQKVSTEVAINENLKLYSFDITVIRDKINLHEMIQKNQQIDHQKHFQKLNLVKSKLRLKNNNDKLLGGGAQLSNCQTDNRTSQFGNKIEQEEEYKANHNHDGEQDQQANSHLENNENQSFQENNIIKKEPKTLNKDQSSVNQSQTDQKQAEQNKQEEDVKQLNYSKKTDLKIIQNLLHNEQQLNTDINIHGGNHQNGTTVINEFQIKSKEIGYEPQTPNMAQDSFQQKNIHDNGQQQENNNIFMNKNSNNQPAQNEVNAEQLNLVKSHVTVKEYDFTENQQQMNQTPIQKNSENSNNKQREEEEQKINKTPRDVEIQQQQYIPKNLSQLNNQNEILVVQPDQTQQNGLLLNQNQGEQEENSSKSYTIIKETGFAQTKKQKQFNHLKLTLQQKQLAKDYQNKFNTVYNRFVSSEKIQEQLNNKSEYYSTIHMIIKQCFYDFQDVLHLLDGTKIFNIYNLIILYIFSDIEQMNDHSIDKQEEIQYIDEIYEYLRSINTKITQQESYHPCLDLKLMMQFLTTIITSKHSFSVLESPLYQDVFKNSLDVIKLSINIDQSIDLTSKLNLNITTQNLEKINSAFNQLADFYKDKLNKKIHKKSSNQLDTNDLVIFLYMVWMKKVTQFQQQIKQKQSITVVEELVFYITLLNNITLEGSQDIISYLLLQIRYLLNRDKQQFSDHLIENKYSKQRSTILNLAKILLSQNNGESVSQRESSLILTLFSQASIRFMVYQIIIELLEIDGLFVYNFNDSNTILKDLSIKHLTEKIDSVKIIFMYSETLQFEIQVLQTADEEIKQQFVEESKTWRQVMLSNMKRSQLSINFENIQTINDLNKLIADTLFTKLVLKIRQNRISDLNTNNNGPLPLYVNQNLTFQSGKNINSSNNYQYKAVETIITDFLIPNYKQPTRDAKTILSREKEKNCKILAILADGGTGKTVFLNQLEMELFNLTQKAANQNTNYVPLLINCVSLNPKNPSIDEYLMSQDLIQEEINMLKTSEGNKLIMLDGYDEYTGESFIIYEQLNLHSWKNTIVIVTSRLEKISIQDTELYFNFYDENGQKGDINNYSIVKLQEFNKNDKQEYFKKFQNIQTTEKGELFNKLNYLQLQEKLIQRENIFNLLKCPINLYLATNIIADIQSFDSSYKLILENATDQIEFLESFFIQQFDTQSTLFIQSLNGHDQNFETEIIQYITNSFFEYFQQIAMTMFLNSNGRTDSLSVSKKRLKETKYVFRTQENQILLLEYQLDQLKKVFDSYIDSGIITRVVKLLESEQQSSHEGNEQQANIENDELIEFRHKQIYEYFCARAMKYDFDVHQENIYNRGLKELKQFNINKRIIMSAGYDVSEYRILHNLYKLISMDKKSSDYTKNYKEEDIKENNRYIQYIKRSTTKDFKLIDVSVIDIGASNLISALFISRYSFDQLQINKCSMSQSFMNKRNQHINFNKCNLSKSIFQDIHPTSIEISNTHNASLETFQKAFDSKNIFSFTKIVSKDNDNIISINDEGYLNQFTFEGDSFTLVRSQKITCNPLKTIAIDFKNNIVVSASKTIFVINPEDFEITFTHKFNCQISDVSVSKKDFIYFVLLQDKNAYQGNTELEFQNLSIQGQISCFSPNNIITEPIPNNNNIEQKTNANTNTVSKINPEKEKDFLVIIDNLQLIIYQIKVDSNRIINQTIIKQYETKSQVSLVCFSQNGKYLVTAQENNTCDILESEKKFEIKSISPKGSIQSISISLTGNYLVTGLRDNTCVVWGRNKDEKYEEIQTINDHTNSIQSVLFSNDDKYLITASKDNTCKQWEVEKKFIKKSTIQGHTSSIYSLAYSPNQKYLATASTDKTCKIWDGENGFILLKIIIGHTDYVQSVTFSPDGKYLVTGSADKTCAIWDVQNNFKFIKALEEHQNWVYSVTFSPDGKYLVTGSADRTCKVWDTQKNYQLDSTLIGHAGWIQSVAFSPNGQYLATGSRDKTCRIWNVLDRFECIQTLAVHTDYVQAVSFSPEGKYLATGSADKTCKIWNIQHNFSLRETIYGHKSQVYSVSFSSNGQYLATGSADKTCKLWNIQKGFKLANTFEGHTYYLKQVVFSPDSKHLATGSADNTWKIWDVQNKFEFNNITQGHRNWVQSVVFSYDKKYFATGSADNLCQIWNAQKDFELIKTIKDHKSWVQSMAFSANGKYFATGSADKTCKIWDVLQGFLLIKTIEDHTSSIQSITFSPGNEYLATGSADKTLAIWDVQNSFSNITTMKLLHTDYIQSIAFSPNGQYLATCSKDKTCKIMDTQKNFELIKHIEGSEKQIKGKDKDKKQQGHSDFIQSLAFSPKGEYLVTGSADNTFKIWDTQKKFELIRTISEHTDNVQSVAFSIDGKYLATGSADQTCKLWNTQKDFELVNTIQGHTDCIQSVAFSFDGKYLATGSADNTCQISIVEKKVEVEVKKQNCYHTDYIQSVAFSPNGKYLATGSADKTCQIWNAKKDYEHVITLYGHTDYVQSVTFSLDGQYLATGSADSTCKVWKTLKDFSLVTTIQGHESSIQSVAFSPDSVYIATGSADKLCKIWNTYRDFDLQKTLYGHDSWVQSIAFSHDGNYLATGSTDKTCKIWNMNKRFKFLQTIEGHTGQIQSVAFSSDKKYLVTGSADCTCKIWNVQQGFKLITTIQQHMDSIQTVSFSPDSKFLITGSADYTCNISNVSIGFLLQHTIKMHTDTVQSVAFSPDGKYLVSGSADKSCKIWNAQNNFELFKTIEGETSQALSSSISPNGMYLAIGYNDKTCKIWNTLTNFSFVKTLREHSGDILSIAFSQKGQYLATGSADHTCNIWNVTQGFKLINTITGHQNSIKAVSFSPDGLYLATGSADMTCKIWLTQSEFSLHKTLEGHSGEINTLAFSSDGTQLATGSADKKCIVWNTVKKFELIHTIEGQTDIIKSLTFSPDGKYLATGCQDNICKIWKTKKNFELNHIIQGHSSSISSVIFSQDGKYIATGSEDKTCKVWNFQKGQDLISTFTMNSSNVMIITFTDQKLLLQDQFERKEILINQKANKINFEEKKNDSEEQNPSKENQQKKTEEIQLFSCQFIL